jgi:hypothetical protein
LISKSQLNKSIKLDSLIQIDISLFDKGKVRSIFNLLSFAEELTEEAKFDENADLEDISCSPIAAKNSILLIVIAFSFFKLPTLLFKFINDDDKKYINKQRARTAIII